MLAGGAGEKAREQALATGMDALLQDLRSRKSESNSGSDNDLAFLRDMENAPCGEELLRQRYRLSTAEAKEEILASGTSWGGEEEELVCGGGGGYANRRPKRNGVGESKGESDSPRMPTPEAGTATVIRGEEKVYDRRRPGLPEEMQSRPMIPRTPTVAVLAVAMEKSNMGVKVERDVCPR
eukprot:jgi/Undpi1/10728/HiC_scaffold_29.g13176.m1